MPQIKCYKNCCAHNYCRHCTREGINVNDDALCSSYNERNETNAENARYEYEFAKDMGDPVDLDGHPITCQTDTCYYHKSGLCGARHVRIDDDGDVACCASFTLK